VHDFSPPVIVLCWLCGDRIDATQHTAWGSGMDHALDHHADLLRVDPDRVMDALTVSSPTAPLTGRAAAHQPGRDGVRDGTP
jgi:hypothetical protein